MSSGLDKPSKRRRGHTALGKTETRITKSQRQEKRVASKTWGRRQPASGALPGAKGDVRAEDFLIECKRTDRKSIRVTQAWLEKIAKEAMEVGKHPALALTFNDMTYDKDWIMVPLRLLDQLRETMEDE